MTRLPTKLSKEPLIDVVFEIRFNTSAPLSNLLPGLLYGAIGGTTIERLPICDIPQQVRDLDPNLANAPLMRMPFGRFAVHIGDRSVSVGCVMPYARWDAFKEAILCVTRALVAAPFIDGVTRYSLKYVDLLPTDVTSASEAMSVQLVIAGQNITNEEFAAHASIERDGFQNLVNLISNATTQGISGQLQSGAIVDIDTIKNCAGESFATFSSDLSSKLDRLHDTNKKLFFQCLKQETIEALGPSYE